MRKESVQKFDLEAAFKALDTVEIPTVKGIRPNRENLQERFSRKLVTDILLEDYYDIGDPQELEQAQEDREAEIAKAKLARIEKIVDLEAESEEDLLPSYVGKLIMQCPQCMTLFYKNEEDIERSEENPDVVNVSEPCQHCGNSSGYTLIGKVDTVGEDEAAQYDVEDFGELDLDNTDSGELPEETEEEESVEEVATEEGTDKDIDLAPIEETEEESKEANESLTKKPLREGWDEDVANADQLLSNIIELSGNGVYDDRDGYWASEDEWCNRYMYYSSTINNVGTAQELCDQYSTENCEFYVFEDDIEEEDPVSEIGYYLSKTIKESLTEDVELNKQMDLYNEFIKYLQKMVEQDEDALEEAKKIGNKEVITAIEKRLENSKAELKAALPATIKDEVAENDLPTPEEADIKAAAENVEKDTPTKSKNESLTEDVDAEYKLAAEEEELDQTNVEDVVVIDNTDNDSRQSVGESFSEDPAESRVVQALTALEADLNEGLTLAEANYNVSDKDFRAMLKNPVFKKVRMASLDEDLPPVSATPFEKAADAIEAAGSELTPAEQRLEDEELAAKEAALGESLNVATDLLVDDGTVAILVDPNKLTPEMRKEKLLADPDFVKALEIFARQYNMVADPEDLEDGVSAVEDMYNCTFEGIENEDLEETCNELISYYLDVKASENLTEAAPQGAVVSKLKRNYSATELMVKELKADPMFSSLSTRTIQRVLLPYYISVMGRRELSAQAMRDFFIEEGFAPYALDHFFTMDPLARKELLKADEKFVQIFNKFAGLYNIFPGKNDAREPGEDDFDFAFKIAFDFDENGIAQDTTIARETITAFSRWYAAGEFDPSLTVDIWGEVEDFNEKDFNKFTENYLTNVYSNVKSFEATDCSLNGNKLIVEGVIRFNSGKTKNTTFTYETKRIIGKALVLEGLNTDFTSEKAFTLNCKVDSENCLIVESLNYKYTINNTLVEGLLK